MKAINFKLATFSFAALLLASCSDSSTSDNSGIGKATTVVGSAVNPSPSQDDLQLRVNNYKIPTTASAKARAALSRAAISRAVDVDDPQVPANATKLSSIEKTWEDQPSGPYVVESGENITAQYNIKGMTIYIKKGGTFNYGSSYGDGARIIILNGGTLVARNSNEVFANTEIMNYGKIEFPKDQSTYLIKKTFYNYYKGDLDLSGKNLDLQASGQGIFVKGSLKAANVTLSNQAGLVCDDLTMTGDLYLTNQSTLVSNGTLKAKSIKLDSDSQLNSGCSVQVEGDVYLTNGTKAYIQYLKAKNFLQDSGSTLFIKDQTMVDCSESYQNQNQGTAYIDLSDKDGVAVFKAPKIIYNAPGPDSDGKIKMDLFRTSGSGATIIVDTKEFRTGGQYYSTVIETSNVNYNANANVLLGSDEESKNYTVKKTECNPAGYNDNDTPSTGGDTKPKPSLDLITSIEYNHDHDISATCIQPLNGHLYMSYHTRGKGHGACVEVFTPVTNNKVTLEQYIQDTDKDLDYNHLHAVKIKSGERMVYMPGSSNNKGAILAYIPIKDKGLLATQAETVTTTENGEEKTITQQPLNFIQLNPATVEYQGYDENCVVYNDETNHLIVMTTKGYVVYDATTKNEVDKIDKPGKAKHVAIGNGKIVTLYLDREATNEDEAIPATIEVFDQKAEDLSNPIAKFSVSTIEPNNGKNVIAVKDNKIYVCRGAAGLYVYDMNGNELGSYQMPSAQIKEGDKAGTYKAYANGCYVGDKYVYVAYGSYGLVVLDKNTLKEVAHRKVAKSANYVVEYNGYIYVAYGKERMQVFQLLNADPEVSYND